MRLRYNPANDGKYRPSNDGKYIHVGDKDRGQYTGGGGEYTGGGGQYNGNGGDYNGGFGKYDGETNGGKSPRIDTRVTVKPATSRPKPTSNPTTAKPKPKSNYNLNAGDKDGWKIIRDEKTEDTDGYHYL